jgi:tetratricopeptide (TPR) repeat protein
MRTRFSQYTLDREQAVALRMNASVALEKEEYFEAEQSFKKALMHWQNVGSYEWIGTVLNDLGELSHKRKNYDLAEQYYNEALEVTKKIDHKEVEVACIGNLGELSLDRAQWTDALKWFELEFMLAKEIGRVSLVAHGQLGLALASEAQEQLEFALPLAQAALKTYEKLQHKDLERVRTLIDRLEEGIRAKE